MSELSYGKALDLARQRLLNPNSYLTPQQAGFVLLQLSQAAVNYTIDYRGPHITSNWNLGDPSPHREKFATLGYPIRITPAATIFGYYQDREGVGAVPLTPDPASVQYSVNMDNLSSEALEHRTVTNEVEQGSLPAVAKDASYPNMIGSYAIMAGSEITYALQTHESSDEHHRAIIAMAQAIPEVTFITARMGGFAPIP